MKMTEIEEIMKFVLNFRDARNWAQFHNSKDLALALSIEAAELNELFLWKKAEDVNVERLKDELADVLVYALFLANNHNFNIKEIIMNKMAHNAEKYPVEKAMNSAKKYNEL